jgi:hypothetical protein
VLGQSRASMTAANVNDQRSNFHGENENAFAT